MIGWVAVAVGLIGSMIAGTRPRLGWSINALAGIPWAIYSIQATLWPVLFTTVLATAIALRNALVSPKEYVCRPK